MSLGGESFRTRGFRRIERDKRSRWQKSGGLNLVSLMDIFTILVFFLLVNSAEVEAISGKASVKLPESISEKKPSETLILVADSDSLVVQGRKIVAIDELEKMKGTLIKPLKVELGIQFDRLYSGKSQRGGTGSITIMGDREIPYRLLKKIMMTCADANFGNISLAVQQKAAGRG